MENLFDITLNINQIASLTGLHRQTVSKRLSSLTPAPGSNSRLKRYKLSDIVCLGLQERASADVDSMSPTDRRAFFQAENERLKFEERTGELVTAFDMARELSLVAKCITQGCETLPDTLEREVGLSPTALITVQRVIDDWRDQIAVYIEQAESSVDTEEK